MTGESGFSAEPPLVVSEADSDGAGSYKLHVTVLNPVGGLSFLSQSPLELPQDSGLHTFVWWDAGH